MKCEACGSDLIDGGLFCHACGKPVISKTNHQERLLICEKCGGQLDIGNNENIIFCPFCGSKRLIIESDPVKIKRIDNKRMMAKDTLDYRLNMLKNKQMAEESKRTDHMMAGMAIGVGVLFIILILFVFISGINDRKKEAEISKKVAAGILIYPTFDNDELENREYNEVIKILEDDGFKNIILVPEETNFFTSNKVGKVSSVKIEGKELSDDQAYAPNVKIKVTYYID